MFLVGLFSVLDAVLDMPLDEAIRDAGMPPRVKATLLGVPSPLRNVLELAFAYERGEWEMANILMEELKLDPGVVAHVFVDSVDYARHATRTQTDGNWSSIPPATRSS
jgi:EAL and modified HD-GYP domain-containing signal transduction protein